MEDHATKNLCTKGFSVQLQEPPCHCAEEISFSFFSPCKFSLDVQRLRINMLKKQLSHNDLGIM